MNHLPRISTSTPATTTRVSPPPSLVPQPVPPTPNPTPQPTPPPPPPPPVSSYPDMRAETQAPTVCESPDLPPAAWISDRGALLIAVTIAIVITVEITMKFYFLRRKKIQYEKYIAEKMEELELEEDDNFFKILRRRLGL